MRTAVRHLPLHQLGFLVIALNMCVQSIMQEKFLFIEKLAIQLHMNLFTSIQSTS